MLSAGGASPAGSGVAVESAFAAVASVAIGPSPIKPAHPTESVRGRLRQDRFLVTALFRRDQGDVLQGLKLSTANLGGGPMAPPDAPETSVPCTFQLDAYQRNVPHTLFCRMPPQEACPARSFAGCLHK